MKFERFRVFFRALSVVKSVMKSIIVAYSRVT